MTKTPLTKSVLAISVATAFSLSSTVTAQETNTGDEPADDLFEQIVVTGTASGKAQRKVESSYATTSLGEEDIKRLAPKSTAELFRAIPGVWSESSGGVSGANVFVRGFPGGGDAPFLTLQLQGVPVFPPPTISFLENSTLFRIDETIQFMEGLRGGPNSVVSNGQPGLTTNFILKEGSEVTEGSFKYTTSDYDLQRVDGVLSGEVAEDLYFMVGGYIQQSPGIRDAGFTSEKGHQFTVNLTKELDNGKINLFSRVTDDHGTWYLPTPLVEGVDNTYTQIGTLNRQATVQFGPDGESQAFDFGRGRGWDGAVSGGSVELDLGQGWSFVDRFAYTSGEANTFGLVPNGDPVALSSVADNGTNAQGAVTGNVYAGDTLVQQIGRWVVLKDIESFTNDLALTKTGDRYEATLGYYRANFSSNDWWALGNHSYHVIASGGENLTGIDCNDNQDSCAWNYDINSTGDGTTSALYAALKYELTDTVTADIGVRSEDHEIEYTVDEGLDGVITKAVQYDESDVAFTAGANWQFEKDMGVFARYSEGSKMPYFDDLRDNFGRFQAGEDLIVDVTQFELGYKLARANFSLYATGFYNEVEGDTFQTQPGAPVQVLTNEAYGIELDGAYYADNGFSVTLNATLQETEITQSPDNQGNEAQRQPGWQIRVTPSYDFDLGDYYGTVYGTLSMVDDRFSDNANSVVLEGYEKLDVGVIMYAYEGFSFEVAVQNVTDEDALTEGDPRSVNSPNGRFILPRTATFSVAYQF
ncbi:TonB-dependent receptor [Alteromonas oceanisediminis]|uniref:TonB-dependent receptor n=1 Tax=Alteromonas oceanisediminis TaxID=2836180 RepID=UPI001BD93617|nr:TonB-dependent receptor [Alteromonas oceanisediminis]MBT0587588.1 TonB-dependent receptor [Alteromonas oceanisediminis]